MIQSALVSTLSDKIRVLIKAVLRQALMDKKEFGRGERASWDNFPKVIRNDDLKMLSKHSEYSDAKSGDTEAAIDLLLKTLKHETVEQCFELLKKHSNVILVPVLAKEEAGNNKIPLVTAKLLSEYLELPFVDNIVQKEKIGRTGKGSDYRLVFNPTFEGFINKSKEDIAAKECSIRLSEIRSEVLVRSMIGVKKKQAGMQREMSGLKNSMSALDSRTNGLTSVN